MTINLTQLDLKMKENKNRAANLKKKITGTFFETKIGSSEF